jgi:hypothetical protein
MRVLLGLLCSCRSHCQDRYGGLAHDAFGDTTQHQVLEPSPAMRRHNHKIRSEPLPCGNDQIAGLSSFDCQLTLNPCKYTLGTLFEPSARSVNLRIVKVLAGESFGRSLGGQRIYLHDVQQINGSAGIRRERRGVRERVSRVWVEVNGTQYFAIRERQASISYANHAQPILSSELRRNRYLISRWRNSSPEWRLAVPVPTVRAREPTEGASINNSTALAALSKCQVFEATSLLLKKAARIVNHHRIDLLFGQARLAQSGQNILKDVRRFPILDGLHYLRRQTKTPPQDACDRIM